MHGARLHGFALLATLGDRGTAATGASRVMAEGARRAAELRHPERAAAWLRARLVRLLGPMPPPQESSLDERGEALAALGVRDFVFQALAALPAEERIALIAGQVERLDPLDVATVLGRTPAESGRIVARARAAYLAAARAAMSRAGHDIEPPAGEVAVRVLSDAARTLGGQSGPA